MLHEKVSVSAISLLFRDRRLMRQHSAAALRFLIDDFELLFFGVGEVGDVLPQLVAIGGIFREHAHQQIADSRILIMAHAIDQRIEAHLQRLESEIGIERQREPFRIQRHCGKNHSDEQGKENAQRPRLIEVF